MQIITLKQVKNNNTHQATITKYEVLEAFFRTEDENDDNMANQLNQLIGNFYEQEQIYKRNIFRWRIHSSNWMKPSIWRRNII